MDHAHNACIGAPAGGCGGSDLERFARVDRAATRKLAGLPSCWDGLASKRRLVDYGRGADNEAIDRNHFPGLHQDPVADRDLFDRHVDDMPVRSAMGNSRCTIDQGFEIAFGAADRKILKNVAAGIHDGYDDARECLVKDQRGAHRDQSDRIDADATSQEVARHRDEQSDDDGDRAPSPAPASDIAPTCCPGCQPQDETGKRGSDQRAAPHSFAEDDHHPLSCSIRKQPLTRWSRALRGGRIRKRT